MMESSNPRVAVYVRCSTQEQSTELQQREIESYAKARSWNQLTWFEDLASGTSSNRPNLQKLLVEARARRIDVIVVWKLDRFARSLKDLVTLLQEFSELGITFFSLKDQIDLGTSAGRLMMHLIGAFAEFEASLIRERVRELGIPRLLQSSKVCRFSLFSDRCGNYSIAS